MVPNLCIQRLTRLDLARRQLDGAVLDTYDWLHDLSDDEILVRLLALNLERAEGCMNPILQKLAGTDRRSIGRSDEVVAEVLANPALFDAVFEGMLAAEPILRMRAADAVEKITAQHPEYLHPYKNKLIRRVARIDQQEVRWHVAQMFSRLDLTRAERRVVVDILAEYLKDQSKIVKTFSMQALADIAEQDADLRPSIVMQLEELTRTGSPAMQSRGRRLLARLARQLET